jgi:dihydrofolate reductase
VARVIYYAAATLDGYIADADDGLDWLTKYEGSFAGEGAQPMKGSYDEFYEGIGALVMGSTTYEWVLEHVDDWPYAGRPTWVLSSRALGMPAGVDGGEVTVTEADVAEIHSEVVAGAGDHDVWIVGGGNVASQYADAGLLDELVVTVVPVVLGEGKPLFDRGVPGGPMQLAGVRPWDTGMVELRYEIGPPRS